MKFPVAECPFPQLVLTSEQYEDIERVATALLLDTIEEFKAFVHQHKRAMHKKQWKALKTRENVTVYKKRDADEPMPKVTLANSSISTTTQGSTSKLVAVGTIVGNLDDVMYGIVTPVAECVKIKTSYVEDDVLDDMVLQQMQYATMDDPYKFLGIKWLVKAGAGVGAKPRDYVLIEATGTHALVGERIGYHIQQSINLPECRDLKDLGLVRATSTTCSLFTQLPNGTVDVYMKAWVEPSCVSTATAEMIDCWKSIWCAQNKKLAWLIREAAAKARMMARQRGRDEFGDYIGTMKTDAKGKHCCALCDQKFSAFRTAVTCELCKAIVCSRCKTARKLTYVHQSKVTKIPTAFCKNCITNANNMNSIDFARSDHIAADTLALSEPESPAPSLTSTHSGCRRPMSSSETSSVRSRSIRKHPFEDYRQLSLADTEGSSIPAYSMDSSEGSEFSFTRDSVEIDAVDEWHRQRPPVTHEGQMILLQHPTAETTQEMVYATPQQQLMDHKRTHHETMLIQMNQLRLQVEQVHRITRQNNHVIPENHTRQW